MWGIITHNNILIIFSHLNKLARKASHVLEWSGHLTVKTHATQLIKSCCRRLFFVQFVHPLDEYQTILESGFILRSADFFVK